MAEVIVSSITEPYKSKSPEEIECLKVVVRCRPFNCREKDAGNECVVTVDTGTVEVKHPESEENKKCFTFDNVYDRFSEQKSLYDESFRVVVDSVLQGYNGTILAYGQTGAGKTFTMEGVLDYEPELRGVIPRSFEHIFQHIAQSDNNQYLVRASYFQIYQEEISDLLIKDQNTKLQIKEHPDTGIYIKDLSSFLVTSVADLEKLLKTGKRNQSVWLTNMSAWSTRITSIFTITVEFVQTEKDGERHVCVGRLNLVDMAGSERPSKSINASGQQLTEATKIGMSLSPFGHVISALVDKKSRHIPYRDSKLTRLLKDSLGGTARTVMVAVIGPASPNYDETLSTLRYANRAKNIKNRPKVNVDPEYALLNKYLNEIERLKTQLSELSVSSKEPTETTDRQNGNLAEQLCDDTENDDTEKSLQEEQAEQQVEKQATLQDTLKLLGKDEHILLSVLQEKVDPDLMKEHGDKEIPALETKIKRMERKLLTGQRD